MNKKAIIFINLGTPNSPEVGDVRAYLREFLSDPLVIDINATLRWMLVNFIIAPFRSRKSSQAYKKVWTEEGSPLLVYSEKFVDKINLHLQGTNTQAFLCMRYGKPSMEEVFKEVGEGGFDQVTLFPLYPQYALSSTQTVMNKARYMLHLLKTDNVDWVQPFFDQPYFIKPLAETIKRVVREEELDYLLYSFHGLPERHISKIPGCESCSFDDSCCVKPEERLTYCYRAQCLRTMDALRSESDTEAVGHSMSFQSRLGSGWLEPFTDVMFSEIADSGVKRLGVVCPAFVADCLETLEEIEMEGHNQFVDAGGDQLVLVPCLNDDELWVKMVGDAIIEGTLDTLKMPVYQPATGPMQEVKA